MKLKSIAFLIFAAIAGAVFAAPESSGFVESLFRFDDLKSCEVAYTKRVSDLVFYNQKDGFETICMKITKCDVVVKALNTADTVQTCKDHIKNLSARNLNINPMIECILSAPCDDLSFISCESMTPGI